MTEWSRRRHLAAALQADHPCVSIEAVHPHGPIGILYLVDRVGYPSLAQARIACVEADRAALQADEERAIRTEPIEPTVADFGFCAAEALIQTAQTAPTAQDEIDARFRRRAKAAKLAARRVVRRDPWNDDTNGI